MKSLKFLADANRALREFPSVVRQEIGFQLYKVQCGEQPSDFKPFPSIGPGVEELRSRDESGAYRAIYTARLAEAVYVLHVFQKKTQRTSKADIDLAKARYKALIRELET